MTKLKSQMSKQEYNDIPVFYCKECLSLKILNLEGEGDFCDDCGCTHITTSHIQEWEKLFEEKYNIKYLNNGREKRRH